MKHYAEHAIHQVKQKSKSKPAKKKEEERRNQKEIGNRKLQSCKYCGQKHIWSRENCPAYRKQCQKCHGNNHFASVRLKTKQGVHTIDDDEDDDDSGSEDKSRNIKQEETK